MAFRRSSADRPPVSGHVGVARHADRVGRQDLVAVVEPMKIQADHVLEQHEVVLAGCRREPDEPGDHLGGYVDDRQRRAGQDGRDRWPERDDETEGAVDEMREGVARIDGERRHHREERTAEVLVQDLGLLGRRPPSDGRSGCPRRPGAAGCPPGSTGAAPGRARARARRRPPASGTARARRRRRSGRPTQIRCLRSATRTMKNSSRFELKIDRNLTRSRRGTVGSWASSSTRRLNSSHDSSRLIMRSDMSSALFGQTSREAAARRARLACRWSDRGTRRTS